WSMGSLASTVMQRNGAADSRRGESSERGRAGGCGETTPSFRYGLEAWCSGTAEPFRFRRVAKALRASATWLGRIVVQVGAEPAFVLGDWCAGASGVV